MVQDNPHFEVKKRKCIFIKKKYKIFSKMKKSYYLYNINVIKNKKMNTIKNEFSPNDIGYIISKVDKIDFNVEKIENILNPFASLRLCEKHQDSVYEKHQDDQWLNINQLCVYHPEKPAKSTVYSWVQSGAIPFRKKGKKLLFLKSEIDSYLSENYNNNKIKY